MIRDLVVNDKLIIHVVTGLSDGGAEAVLYRLCLHDMANQHIVISMMGPGKYGPLLSEADIEVYCMNLHAGKFSLSGLFRLFSKLSKHKPYAVQTWMYHADLVGGVCARFAGIKNVCWNIRHSELERGKSKRSTIWVAKTFALLSRCVPRKIVCCAEKAMVRTQFL